MAVRNDNTAEVLTMDDTIKAQQAIVEDIQRKIPLARNLDEVVNLLQSYDAANEHLHWLWSEHNRHAREDVEIQQVIDEAERNGELHE